MDKSIEQMNQDLTLAKYADGTREQYLNTVTRFRERFACSIMDIEREQVRSFVEEIVACTKSKGHLVVQLAALRFLYNKTLGRPDMISFLVAPRKTTSLPTVLSLKEVDALLRAIEVERYQAIVMVMYGAGLRITETLALEVSDIDGERGVIRVKRGKRGKAREAKLSPSLYEWLRNYWARTKPPAPFLFSSRRTQRPPEAETVRKALSLAAKNASIQKHVTPHVLRHSFATHLLEEGTDIHVVSALLGHASLKSTAHYARVTQKIVRQTPSPLDLLPHKTR